MGDCVSHSRTPTVWGWGGGYFKFNLLHSLGLCFVGEFRNLNFTIFWILGKSCCCWRYRSFADIVGVTFKTDYFLGSIKILGIFHGES